MYLFLNNVEFSAELLSPYIIKIEVYAKINQSVNAKNLTDGYYIYGQFFLFDQQLWIMYNSYKRLTVYDTLHVLFIFNVTDNNSSIEYLLRNRKFIVGEHKFHTYPFDSGEPVPTSRDVSWSLY